MYRSIYIHHWYRMRIRMPTLLPHTLKCTSRKLIRIMCHHGNASQIAYCSSWFLDSKSSNGATSHISGSIYIIKWYHLYCHVHWNASQENQSDQNYWDKKTRRWVQVNFYFVFGRNIVYWGGQDVVLPMVFSVPFFIGWIIWVIIRNTYWKDKIRWLKFISSLPPKFTSPRQHSMKNSIIQ